MADVLVNRAAHRRMQAIRNRLADLVSGGHGLSDPDVLFLSRALDEVVLEVMGTVQGDGTPGGATGGAAGSGGSGGTSQQG